MMPHTIAVLGLAGYLHKLQIESECRRAAIFIARLFCSQDCFVCKESSATGNTWCWKYVRRIFQTLMKFCALSILPARKAHLLSKLGGIQRCRDRKRQLKSAVINHLRNEFGIALLFMPRCNAKFRFGVILRMVTWRRENFAAAYVDSRGSYP